MINHRVLLILPLAFFAGMGTCYSNDMTPVSKTPPTQKTASMPLDAEHIAARIRQHYEQDLYQLSPALAGDFSLSLYRQRLDKKYRTGIHNELAQIANKLNYFANEINTPEAIYMYAQAKLAQYKNDPSPQAQIRYSATKHIPQYLCVGSDLLTMMAKIDDYGLKYKEDKKLHKILQQFNFPRYMVTKDMIRAWAGQLASQVFWLRQLGEKEAVNSFISAFRATYPDSQDSNLDRQQYENKLSGMTHIILADSKYLQQPVSESQYQWIYDYFRQNINTILLRASPDIVAEVGISFLLAGQDQDPVVKKCQDAVMKKFDSKQNRILLSDKNDTLSQAEHANVLAVILLDWQGVHLAPTITHNPKMFRHLPYGLVPKHHQKHRH